MAEMNTQSQLVVEHMTTKFSNDMTQVTDIFKNFLDELCANSKKGEDEELLRGLTQVVQQAR